MTIHVDTHIAGAHCAIWKDPEHYIDCRKGKVYGAPVTNIECVRDGQVYRRVQVFDSSAPERIVQIMKEEQK